MRAILIDPFKCEVTEIDFDNSSFENFYPLLSHETMLVDCFTTAPNDMLDDGETLYVDDEGLLKNPQRGFMLGNGQLLAGKGLILGSDEEGETIGTKIPLETIIPWVVAN